MSTHTPERHNSTETAVAASSLNGKVAIITGGSKGVGRGVANAYVKEGVAVVLTGRSKSSLDEAKAEIESEVPGARVLTIAADNTDHDAPAHVVDRTMQAYGRLDILVNNAQQFLPMTAFEDHTWDDFYSMYESGVFAAWRYMIAAFPHLKTAGGTIINMASGAGTNAEKMFSAYGSSKEALRGLSRIAAKEWGPHRITVNVVCPAVMTPIVEQYYRESPEYMAEATTQRIPLGYYGDAELNVGGLCVFLAKPEGSFTTGATIDVDGGASIRP